MESECTTPFGPGKIADGLLRKVAAGGNIGGYILLDSAARSHDRASLLATCCLRQTTIQSNFKTKKGLRDIRTNLPVDRKLQLISVHFN
jgi:hypothetical protein